MKYIKNFENVSFGYNVGDYVVLCYQDTIGKIKYIGKNNNEDYFYTTEVIIENQLIPLDMLYENIKRKATPQEVEEWKLKNDQNKYNL